MTQQPYYPPQYPQAPQQPAQQYPPANYPMPPAQAPAPYPPQQYQQPYAPPAQQAPPPAQGTLDDFYNQPSTGGGAALKFEQLGTRYIGIVTRTVGPGDVSQQTDTRGVPQFFKDGRPKWVMKVPLQMQPSQQHPDGLAQWYVKGAARDELVRAMSEAGAPEGAPEPGSIIDIEFVATRQSGPGMNPAKLFRVRYTRPDGAEPVAAAPSPVADQAPIQQPQPVAQAQAAPPANYAPAPPQVQQYAAQPVVPQQPLAPAPQAPQQQYVQQPPPAQAQYQQPVAPADMSPEQQALLARLTGAQG